MSLITVNVNLLLSCLLFSRITHVMLLKTQLCDCSVFSLSSQDHLLERSPFDHTHQDASDQSHGVILVDEPHILLPTNNADRRVHDIESSPNIQMLDEMPDSLTEVSEVKAQNVTLLMDKNMIPPMTSNGHWETNSHTRHIEEEQQSGSQHRESLPSVLAVGTGNIIYGSDRRIYRIHKGPSGPIGPQGRRVRISLGWN